MIRLKLDLSATDTCAGNDQVFAKVGASGETSFCANCTLIALKRFQSVLGFFCPEKKMKKKKQTAS